MVIVVHTCLIQKMRKVCLRLGEIYLLAIWKPMESYLSLFIRTYDVILLGYTCVPGFHIGGHVYSVFCLNFFLTIKITKIRSIRIIDNIIANKKQSQLSWNPSHSFQFIHSFSIFLIFLQFLPSFS